MIQQLDQALAVALGAAELEFVLELANRSSGASAMVRLSVSLSGSMPS